MLAVLIVAIVVMVPMVIAVDVQSRRLAKAWQAYVDGGRA